MKIYIYCIYNNEYKNDFYIGSTKNYKHRMQVHNSDCNNPNSHCYNLKLYKFIREHGGWSNWSKIIIATVDVEDKIHQKRIEQVYIDHLEPGLNDYRSYQSHEQLIEYKKEWYNKNKEYLTEKHKEYYNKNKEKIREWQSKKIDCICGSRYTKTNKARHEKSIKHKNYIENN